MTRRRRHRPISDREFVRSLQRVRLQGLATGEYAPLSSREQMYLYAVREGVAVDIEDFIVSRPLLLLESAERAAAEQDAPPAEST